MPYHGRRTLGLRVAAVIAARHTRRGGPGSVPRDHFALLRCQTLGASGGLDGIRVACGRGIGGGEAIENGGVLVGGEARGALGQRDGLGGLRSAGSGLVANSHAARCSVGTWFGSTARPARQAARAGAAFPRASSALPRLKYAGAKARLLRLRAATPPAPRLPCLCATTRCRDRYRPGRSQGSAPSPCATPR